MSFKNQDPYLGMSNFIIERESPLRVLSRKSKPKRMSVHYQEEPNFFDSSTEGGILKKDQEKFLPTPLMRRSYSEIGSFEGIQFLLYS